MKSVNYLALLLVIVIGVAGGNLLSNWISVAAVTYGLQELAERSTQQMAKQRVRSAADQEIAADIRRKKMRKERAASRHGLDLARRCSEWRYADDQNHTVTTRLETEKSCDRYAAFLDTGN